MPVVCQFLNYDEVKLRALMGIIQLPFPRHALMCLAACERVLRNTGHAANAVLCVVGGDAVNFGANGKDDKRAEEEPALRASPVVAVGQAGGPGGTYSAEAVDSTTHHKRISAAVAAVEKR